MAFVNFGDTYTVQSGDTLNAIGARFGMTAQQIADLNNIEDIDVIDVGQVLQMPYGVVAATKIEEQAPVVQKVVQAVAPQPAPLAVVASTAQKVASAIAPKPATDPATVQARKTVPALASSGISMSTVLMGGAAVALAAALILIIKKRREA